MIGFLWFISFLVDFIVFIILCLINLWIINGLNSLVVIVLGILYL